jgi:TRAP-type mannitol/chloroaromatic compound transport system substrate-binding protein
MKRRNFLTGAAAGGALAAASSFPAPAIARGVRALKMVTTWPKNFPGLGTAAERLAKRLAEATDGQITLRVFGAGELVPAFGAFDAVARGTIDMYHATDYYWQGKSQAYNFFSTVPFGMTGLEHAAWIYYGGGQQLWDELSSGFGVKPFLAGNTGVQMGGWYKRPIDTLEDFRGLKVRMPGLGGEVLRRIGAAVQVLPGGEIFPALQQGSIDGTEWIGPWNDLAFGFYKIAKYYYYPGFHEPGTALAAGINLEVWNSFSKTQQAVISAIMEAEHSQVFAEFTAQNARALTVLREKHNIVPRRFSDDILRALGKQSAIVVAEVAAKDAMAKRVYDSYRAFAGETAAWGRISELAYGEARELLSKDNG